MSSSTLSQPPWESGPQAADFNKQMELITVKIEEIKKAWIFGNRDAQSDMQIWDSQADDPTYHHIYDEFLKMLETEGMIDKRFDVLDVGCGAGIYSVALSGKVDSVTGVDISPKMLAHGRKMIEDTGLKNVTLRQMDWNTADLNALGMKEHFDLVFAHNTPAICDMETFEKLNDASRRFCAVCSPIKMIEPIMQEVRKIAGISNGEECDSNFTYMLDILLHKNHTPKLHYEKQVWPMNQSFEDACAFYIGRVKKSKELSKSEISDIKEYLGSLSKEGIISDRIDTTVATIYWEK